MQVDARTARLSFRQRLVVFRSDTGGHTAILAIIGRRLAVELWVDRYAGSDSPAVWIGFASGYRSDIARVARYAAATPFGGPRILRTSRDVVKEGRFFRLRHPLEQREFDVQVLERYREYHFLGMYLAYR